MVNTTIKKVLVTGGAGFIGRHIVSSLKNVGHKVTAPTNKELDITKLESIKKAVKKYKPEIIVNCAAITGYANCRKDPKKAWDVNVNGVASLAKICLENNILFVQPSSATIFDGTKKNAYKEGDPTSVPKNISGRTKYAAEQIVLSSGVEYIIPRITTVYGYPENNDTTNILKNVVDKLSKEGRTLPLFCDQFANFAAADEVGNAIASLVETRFQGIIHLGGPDRMSIWEFANIAKEEFNLEGKVVTGTVEGTDYPPNMVLDISLAKNFGLKFSSVREKLRQFSRI